MYAVRSLWLAAGVALLPRVASKAIFAHYMVGTVTEDHAHQDIDNAKKMGLDGFVLNIGDATQSFVDTTLHDLFGYAEYVGGFSLYISMDVYASGAACYASKTSCNGPDDYYSIFQWTLASSAYYKGPNGFPMISTFSSGGFENDTWSTWKETLANQMYFIPDFDETTGYYGGSESYSGWYYYWGDVIDGLFSWESAWPERIAPSPGTVGGAFPGDVGPDVTVMAGARQYNKGYMMGLSTLQYKNSYGTNVYRAGGSNLPARMANILAMSDQPDWIVVQTWNDGPESHYIGNLWPEQNTDTQPAAYMGIGGAGWDHSGWQSLITSFTNAWKAGGSASSMAPVNGQFANGALWYQTKLVEVRCPKDDGNVDSTGSEQYWQKPDGYTAASDSASWAIVMPQGSSGYSVKIYSGGGLIGNTNLQPGLNYGDVQPVAAGQQYMELVDGSGTVVMTASGGTCLSSGCPTGIYNLNYQVLELTENATPTSCTEPGAVFVQIPTPNACSSVVAEPDVELQWWASGAGPWLDNLITQNYGSASPASFDKSSSVIDDPGVTFASIHDLVGQLTGWGQTGCQDPTGTLCPMPSACPTDTSMVAPYYVQKSFANFHDFLNQLYTQMTSQGLLDSLGIGNIISNISLKLQNDQVSSNNIIANMGGALGIVGTALGLSYEVTSAATGVLGGLMSLVASNLPTDSIADPNFAIDAETVLQDRLAAALEAYWSGLSTLGTNVLVSNNWADMPSYALQPDGPDSTNVGKTNPYQTNIANFFQDGKFFNQITNVDAMMAQFQIYTMQTLAVTALANANVYVMVNAHTVDDCPSVGGALITTGAYLDDRLSITEAPGGPEYCYTLEYPGQGAGLGGFSKVVDSDVMDAITDEYRIDLQDLFTIAWQCQNATNAYYPGPSFVVPTGAASVVYPECFFSLPVFYVPTTSAGAPSGLDASPCALRNGDSKTGKVGYDYLPDSLASIFTDSFCVGCTTQACSH